MNSNKTVINKKQMKELTTKNYYNLPEIKKKLEDERKKEEQQRIKLKCKL